MLLEFLSKLNWLHVLVAAAGYWVVGVVWYSAIFNKVWEAEITNHGVKLSPPSGGKIAQNVILTYVMNLCATIAVAFLIHFIGSTTVMEGIKVGLYCGFGYIVTSGAMGYIWEGRSMKLVMIDTSSHIVGLCVAAIILSVWS